MLNHQFSLFFLLENAQRVFLMGKIIKHQTNCWISMISIFDFHMFPHCSHVFHHHLPTAQRCATAHEDGPHLLEVSSVRRPQQGGPGLGVALGANGQAEGSQAAGAMLHAVAEVEHLAPLWSR